MKSIFSFFIFLSFSVFASENEILERISHKVHQFIELSEEISGLSIEEFSTLKESLTQDWEHLISHGNLTLQTTDRIARPRIVGVQGILEHVLASELGHTIKSLKGIIHTPMPATPLCTLDEVSAGLVDPVILNDPLRAYTVSSRALIIRQFLNLGGTLFVAYPSNGIHKRTEAQKNIYYNELLRFPTNLIDCPLNCEVLENNLIGAVYCFSDAFDRTFVFAIQMTQANNPLDWGTYSLWFGEIENGFINTRVSEVFNFLINHSHPIQEQRIKDYFSEFVF